MIVLYRIIVFCFFGELEGVLYRIIQTDIMP